MNNTSPLINLSYKLKNRKTIEHYKYFRSNYDTSLEALEEEQVIAFRKLFIFCKRNVPFYEKLFRKIKLEASDFKSINDLKKIPLLTKSIISKNYGEFSPRNYTSKFIVGATGGSTGDPLKYRMSIEDYSRGVALLYRGLNKGGYNYGDKMAVLAGGSLVKGKPNFSARINNAVLNYKKFSSYGMGEKELEECYNQLMRWQPKFFRGYASSLTLFANYCIDNNKRLEFQSVFSTAEMLLPSQRDIIEKAFSAKVYNNYGLNDGGVSAYETGTMNEFHIDTERAVLEIVKENEIESTHNSNGRIIATSLYNYAFPFIRYDTGDNGNQVATRNNRNILTKLSGRSTDYIVFAGKTIGSPVLTVLMGKIDAIKYQIIQKKDQSLEIRILKGDHYDLKQELFILESLKSNIDNNLEISIIYTDQFIKSQNKHKFIIKE